MYICIIGAIMKIGKFKENKQIFYKTRIKEFWEKKNNLQKDKNYWQNNR